MLKHTNPSLDCIDGNLPEGWRGGILLAVASPSTAGGLAALAADNHIPVLVVNVRVNMQMPGRGTSASAPSGSPDLMRWPAVANALAIWAQRNVSAAWLVCSAADIGRGIRRIASAVDARLILLGWRGRLRPDGAYLNATLKDIRRDPGTDVAVVGGRSPERFSQVLLPYAGGPHSHAVGRLTFSLGCAIIALVCKFVWSSRNLDHIS